MTKPISQDVFVVVNPQKGGDYGYWIKGVYSTIEAAACAAQEEMDCVQPDDRDKIMISRHRLIDTIEAKTSLIKHLDWMKELGTESIEKEEQANKEKAQEIINEESTKADGTPCSYEEGDLTA